MKQCIYMYYTVSKQFNVFFPVLHVFPLFLHVLCVDYLHNTNQRGTCMILAGLTLSLVQESLYT